MKEEINNEKFVVFLLIMAILTCAAYQVYFTVELTPYIEDLSVAKTNLKDAGYNVMHFKVGDGILVSGDGRIEYLIANESSIGSTGNSNMLNIQVFENRELAGIYYRQLRNNVESTVKGYKIEIEIYEYQIANNGDLSDKEIEEINKNLQELREEVAYHKSRVIGLSGSVIWIVTKPAIKASHG